MSDCNHFNNANTSNISQETEDGEIEDINSNTAQETYDKEIDEYYKKLKNLGNNLRCSCCNEVFSDPVKLNCDHLIDRYCIATKIVNKTNTIICLVCQKETYCEDMDDLLTDFDIASQIPPKPNSLIELINNKQQEPKKNQPKRIKLEEGWDGDRVEVKKDNACENVNGDKIKKEKLSSRRRKKTRWSAVEDKKMDSNESIPDNPQATFTGVISDILAANNLPKNITISQFKKYTEISSKTDIMNVLTEVVMQNTKTDSNNLEKKSHSLSDKEILDMIPSQELEDLYNLEKIQLILLYREALDKGVILLPSPKKTIEQSSSSKQALLPTPKPSSNGSIESQEKSSPTSSRKRYTSESSKSSNISYPNSVKSLLDSSDSESTNDVRNRSHKKHKYCKTISKSSLSSKKMNHSKLKTKSSKKNVSDMETPQIQSVTSNSIINSQNIPSSTSENQVTNSTNSKVATNDCQKMCDNIRYRDDINRLHALYSIMYHASLKMKDFENKIDSEDYQSSYKTYCDNYTEYQHLYSSLQSVINIDSISADKPDSISNSCTGSDNTPLVNGINIAVSTLNQEQASSTISPAFYAPDSTDSIPDNKPGKPVTQNSRVNSETKANNANNLTTYRQFKKEHSLEPKKNFGYLWISNLSKDIRTNDLCKVFGKFGHISKVKLFQYKAHVPPSHFGLVFMPNFNEAENAVQQLQNKVLNDKQIQIKMLENNPLSDDRMI